MAVTRNQYTKEQQEFVVRKLAAFYAPRDVAMAFAAQFPDVKFNEQDARAYDVAAGALVSPELFMLFRSERERVLIDPASDPYTDQKARLILLSRMVDALKNNNQPGDARAILRQIAEELGVVGGKASTGAKGGKDDALPDFKEITVKRTVVSPS